MAQVEYDAFVAERRLIVRGGSLCRKGQGAADRQRPGPERPSGNLAVQQRLAPSPSLEGIRQRRAIALSERFCFSVIMPRPQAVVCRCFFPAFRRSTEMVFCR